MLIPFLLNLSTGTELGNILSNTGFKLHHKYLDWMGVEIIRFNANSVRQLSMAKLDLRMEFDSGVGPA